MDANEIVDNLSDALLQFAKSAPAIIRSSFDETQIEYPEYLSELLAFFPFDKVDWNTGTYDQYLFDLQKTIKDNYEKGNFQVAYFYSHFVFMSYVYYCIEKAYKLEPDRIKDVYFPINAYSGRDDKPNIASYISVYDFSKIPEKEIFKIFHVMGMPPQQIKDLSKYISTRDDFAHATGKGNISEDELESNLRSIKGNMFMLHKIFELPCKNDYIDFLLSNYSLDYSELNDVFEDMIFDKRISLVDLQFACNMGISGIRDSNEDFKNNYHKIKKVHCAFIEYCIENYGLSEPDGYRALRDESYLFYRYTNLAEEYIENELGLSAYSCVKDGDEFPLYECPDCEEEQFVFDTAKGEYRCFVCGASYSEGVVTTCCDCNKIMIDTEEIVCDDCLEAKMDE